MKYKCEKGEKQHKVCKEYGMDICSDCPHGTKIKEKKVGIGVIVDKAKEQEEAIDRLENLSEYGLCYTITEDIQQDLKMVLSMLKEKDKQIEYWKKGLERKIEKQINYLKENEDCIYCNNTCNNYARCMLLQKIKKELLEDN